MNSQRLYTKLTRNLLKSKRQLERFAGHFIKTAPEQPALSPGSLIYRGEVRTDKIKFTSIDYNLENHTQKDFEAVEDCLTDKEPSLITWINISGVHDVGVIEKLGKHYGIHPLVLEDVVHTNQRPKVEDHGDYLYIVLRMLRFNEEQGKVESEQVSFILGKGWLLTLQEKEGDVFEPVRERARNREGRIRKFSADYLAYALIDAIVDHYFIVLEIIGDKIDVLEDLIQDWPNTAVLQQTHRLKREMISMRKSIWPLREVVNQLYKDDMSLIKDATRIYLRDVYDHTIQIIETVESFRDMLSGLQDLYQSAISNRMNEVMKVLTIIATLFIPPTFVAGVYGMNFDNMPELHTPFGYFAVLGVMFVCIIAMLVFFRRRKWL